jgi:hypothetical protein
MTLEYTSNYMIAVADQLSFVSTFLGGVSATILITIVILSSTKKSTNLLVVTSAIAACTLLIAVISAWRLTIALHPDIPVPFDVGNVLILWRLMIISYIIGFTSLIVAIGISGWIRSKRIGLITSSIAAFTLITFMLTSSFV